MDEQQNIIIVSTNDNDFVDARGKQNKEIHVEVLEKNVNLFIMQIGNILEKTPEKIGRFELTEITVTAEISAKGSLVLLGTGVESEGKGGMSFVFTRK